MRARRLSLLAGAIGLAGALAALASGLAGGSSAGGAPNGPKKGSGLSGWSERAGPVQGPQVIVVRELPPPGQDDEPPPRDDEESEREVPDYGVRAVSHAPVPYANAIDRGVVAGLADLSPPELSTNFDGLSSADNSQNGTSPPDPQIAAGPAHIIELVNLVGRVYDKNGGVLQTMSLRALFGGPQGYFYFDPRVIYDTLSGRFFASLVSGVDNDSGPDEGRLYVAASQTSDPTGAWNVFFVPYVDIFPDFQGLGVTDDKVTVSGNFYDIDGPPNPVPEECTDDGYCGEQTIVFQKSDLLAGATSPGTFLFRPNLTRFTVRPAQSLSPTNDQYLATFTLSSDHTLKVIRISGTPNEGNVVIARTTNVNVLTHDSPPPSRTAGTAHCVLFEEDLGAPACIDSGDFRLLETVWVNNQLWANAPAACAFIDDPEPRSCAHIIDVETVGAPSVKQDIMYGAPGEFYSWPALRPDASGNIHVVLTHTNTAIFAEARIAGRRAGDPEGLLSPSVLLRAGEVQHTSGRWGDYLGAAVDPEQPGCVWLLGEYAKNASGAAWGTYAGASGYDGSCLAGAATPTTTDTATATWTPRGTLTPSATPTETFTPTLTPSATPTETLTPTLTYTPTRTATPTATPTPPGPRGDADCSRRVDAVDAALVLQRGAGLTSSLACADRADANGDGHVDAVDAAVILQFVAGLLDSLAP